MTSLLILRNGSLASRLVSERLWRFRRCFQSDKPVSSDSINSSNDILLNATASMRKNRDSGVDTYASGVKFQQTKNAAFSKRKPNMGNASPGQQHAKKRFTVKWTTGTERAQEAANHTLQQIFKLNERGVVKVVSQQSNTLEERLFVKWAAGLDLGDIGFTIVNVEQRGSYSIPLIKVVDAKTALKKYSDELARRKEEELSKMGFSNKRLGKKIDRDSGDDNLKQIKVSWQISDADLNKQKAHEITSQLKKGYKVYLYLDRREELGKTNWSEDVSAIQEDEKKARSPKLSSRELMRRQEVMDRLQEIVDEFALQPVLNGSIDSRLIMKLTPKTTSTNKSDKAALKEERKQLRQKKLESKLLKKKQKESV
ncbi:LAME_0G05292g1_1 [Lachancea meyersii CBS 8951]|uniref:Altered inheritance of mitochondria protein 23, mitochondrial n=1 Tax=Lachancea meyersii CBS 8951 TaxID=1266667 RepID=A0A1G4K754_9SACH|nr:LAME_0G05292g1_1 [Lachancea meyersii CBS 8951]